MGAPDDDRRAELETERDSLSEQLDTIEAQSAPDAVDDGLADSGQVAAAQDEQRALAADLREQLSEVDSAIERLDAGTYGVCQTCGERIPDERLEAVPTARFCIAHAG